MVTSHVSYFFRCQNVSIDGQKTGASPRLLHLRFLRRHQGNDCLRFTHGVTRGRRRDPTKGPKNRQDRRDGEVNSNIIIN